MHFSDRFCTQDELQHLGFRSSKANGRMRMTHDGTRRKPGPFALNKGSYKTAVISICTLLSMCFSSNNC